MSLWFTVEHNIYQLQVFRVLSQNEKRPSRPSFSGLLWFGFVCVEFCDVFFQVSETLVLWCSVLFCSVFPSLFLQTGSHVGQASCKLCDPDSFFSFSFYYCICNMIPACACVWGRHADYRHGRKRREVGLRIIASVI